MALLIRRVEKSGRRSPDLYTGLDVMSLGHLACGFNESTSRKIRISSYMTASAVLGHLANCSVDVLQHLARVAVKIQVYGAIRSWKASIVTQFHYYQRFIKK